MIATIELYFDYPQGLWYGSTEPSALFWYVVSSPATTEKLLIH